MLPIVTVAVFTATILWLILRSTAPAGSGYSLARAQIEMIKSQFSKLAARYESTAYPAAFLLSIIGRESQGVRTAKGRSGEVGIFQIMSYHFPEKMSDKDRIKDQNQFEIATKRVLSDYAWRLIKAGKLTPRNLAAMYNGGPGGWRDQRPQQYGRDVERLLEKFKS